MDNWDIVYNKNEFLLSFHTSSSCEKSLFVVLAKYSFEYALDKSKWLVHVLVVLHHLYELWIEELDSHFKFNFSTLNFTVNEIITLDCRRNSNGIHISLTKSTYISCLYDLFFFLQTNVSLLRFSW